MFLNGLGESTSTAEATDEDGYDGQDAAQQRYEEKEPPFSIEFSAIAEVVVVLGTSLAA